MFLHRVTELRNTKTCFSHLGYKIISQNVLLCRLGATNESTIDHFVTNLSHNEIKDVGVVQFEATDHLPIFGIVKLHLPKHLEPIYYRCNFDPNKKDEFCSSLLEKLQAPVSISRPYDPASAL